MDYKREEEIRQLIREHGIGCFLADVALVLRQHDDTRNGQDIIHDSIASELESIVGSLN